MKIEIAFKVCVVLLCVVGLIMAITLFYADKEIDRLNKELDDLTAECNSLKIDYESVLDTYGR